MKTSTQFKNMNGSKPRRILALVGLTIFTGISMTSCVVTDSYYGESGGSYYGEPSGSYYGGSSYGNYAQRSSYRRPYYGHDDYRWNDSRRHDSNRYEQRDSRIYHSNAGRDHKHPPSTSSDKFRLVNYRENKKSSHPSGYHDADYWKSRGYSVKKNTYEKKDGKIVGSRKELKKSKRH